MTPTRTRTQTSHKSARMRDHDNGCPHHWTRPRLVGSHGLTYNVDICEDCGHWATALMESSRLQGHTPKETDPKRKGGFVGPRLEATINRKTPSQRKGQPKKSKAKGKPS